MNPLSTSTMLNILLPLAGLLILLLNLLISVVRLRRGHQRAGIVNVGLTLIACGLITFGLVRMTFPMLVRVAPIDGVPAVTASIDGVPAADRFSPDRLPVIATSIGALVLGLLGFILWRVERRRDGYNPSTSPGLLYFGAAFYMFMTAFLIPVLPAQFTRAQAQAAAQQTPTGPIPTRQVFQTATATITPAPLPTETAPHCRHSRPRPARVRHRCLRR
jgi:hypothetical protein